MIKKIHGFWLLLLVFALSIGVPVMYAQETEPSPVTEVTPEPVNDVIFEQETVRPEIERLRISYRGLIEDYRNKERQYQLAKADYQQLNTLRSLEEAVKATREAIIARTDVLLTYFELLKLELQESEGIELQRKTKALSDVESEIIYLREFKETALAAQDREQVIALTPAFSEHILTLNNRGYYGLSLVIIGRLQAVHDKARIIQSDLQTELQQQEASEFVRGQRDRGFVQTTQSLETANIILNEELVGLSASPNQSSYNNVREKLNPVYAQLSQSVSYLRELLEL